MISWNFTLESKNDTVFSQEKSKVSFDPNITKNGGDEIDFHRTPMKQNESIKEIKQSSALKSLKVFIFLLPSNFDFNNQADAFLREYLFPQMLLFSIAINIYQHNTLLCLIVGGGHFPFFQPQNHLIMTPPIL